MTEWKQSGEYLTHLLNGTLALASFHNEGSKAHSCNGDCLHGELREVPNLLGNVYFVAEDTLSDVQDAECRRTVQIDVLEVEHNGVDCSAFHQFVLQQVIVIKALTSKI